MTNQVLCERLNEMIMEDVEAQAWVNDYAKKCLIHVLGECPEYMTEIQEELYCQYQVQAWNKLFHKIAHPFN